MLREATWTIGLLSESLEEDNIFCLKCMLSFILCLRAFLFCDFMCSLSSMTHDYHKNVGEVKRKGCRYAMLSEGR